MIDWQDKVSSSQLRCAICTQPIAPGSEFYSALRVIDGRFERLDYLPDHWNVTAVDGLISWWKQRRPAAHDNDKGPRLVNHTVLLSIFHELREATERPQQCFVWLITLLLTRSKKLRYLDLVLEGTDSFLLVEDKNEGKAFKVLDPQMTEEEQNHAQDDLQRIFNMPIE
jgi:hypothetical protein